MESQIVALNNRVEEEKGNFFCLENGFSRIVGAATLFDSASNYHSHLKILDFLIHPNHWDYTIKLLDPIIAEDAKRAKKQIISYLASCDKEKLNWLKKLGFGERGAISNYFQKGEEKVNLIILSSGG